MPGAISVQPGRPRVLAYGPDIRNDLVLLEADESLVDELLLHGCENGGMRQRDIAGQDCCCCRRQMLPIRELPCFHCSAQIKGGPSDCAVLCTENATFSLKTVGTTNSVFVVRDQVQSWPCYWRPLLLRSCQPTQAVIPLPHGSLR